MEPIPQLIIMGLPLEAVYSISGTSTNSGEAILYAPHSIDSKKSTDVGSNTLERKSIPSFSHSALMSVCHSQGVCASS